eukprot:gnl/TRDRNA2_/TRDRNA2_149550_c1_seq2.p1 gnl/TRDRNA2_/TRDRNA2_149550_c1~~gnl/TRDRNA2_/TRDRNA2_149550_c1_seq2.p1  ORF type:complete len:408 (-),score=51.74 gnl/TRDRNA2_/TRDRNA2_149550_c1_seq2:210-1373(-)
MSAQCSANHHRLNVAKSSELIGTILAQQRQAIDDSDPSEILDGFLYLGDADHATSGTVLSRLAITHIVNVTQVADLKPDAEADTYVVNSSATGTSGNSEGCQPRHRLQLPVHDHENVEISMLFETSNEFIDAAFRGTETSSGAASGDIATTHRVLVHCMAGRSRSATIVIAYLMARRDMTLRQAIDHVKFRRPMIFPNLGFLEQLVEYEKKLIELHPARAATGVSELPHVFRDALSQGVLRRTATNQTDSPVRLYQKFCAAAAASSLLPAAADSGSGCEISAELADELAKGWSPLWAGPSAVREVLASSFEELPAESRRLCVRFLAMITRHTSSKDRLTKNEVFETFNSLKNDHQWRDDLRLDIPLEGQYFVELEEELANQGIQSRI